MPSSVTLTGSWRKEAMEGDANELLAAVSAFALSSLATCLLTARACTNIFPDLYAGPAQQRRREVLHKRQDSIPARLAPVAIAASCVTWRLVYHSAAI